MKKRIEGYIPLALTAIKDVGIPNDDNTIDKQYNGYIASLGASIRQAGLLATHLFYSNANSNAEKDRAKIIQAIEEIIGFKLNNDNTKQREIKLQVLDAATALKLAIRTYSHKEN